MNVSKLTFLQQNPVFTTREFSILTGVSISSASRTLHNLLDKKDILKLTRNIWMNPSHPKIHPFICVYHLLNNECGYISFLSALHNYGILSQIPRTIFIATTGHSRILKTPIATYQFLHIKPELMTEGITMSDTSFPYNIASPEKALLDTLYISSRKNNLFASLPELEITRKSFSKKKFFELLKRLELPSLLRGFIQKKASRLLKKE
jgi:predicted transcriptional regulator of viral defense system